MNRTIWIAGGILLLILAVVLLPLMIFHPELILFNRTREQSLWTRRNT